MHEDNLHLWQHSHAFGQDVRRPGETRTLIVIAITAVMMVVEIAAGISFGSMALLADGLHMASHTAALTINAFAYMYARQHAHNEEFSFGTGKVGNDVLDKLIAKHFDMRPKAIIEALDLKRPIFRKTAAYGHFGRSDLYQSL